MSFIFNSKIFFFYLLQVYCAFRKKHFRGEGSAVSDLIAAAMQFFFFFKYMTSAVILCMYICKQNEHKLYRVSFSYALHPPLSFSVLQHSCHDWKSGRQYEIQHSDGGTLWFQPQMFSRNHRWEDLRGSFPDWEQLISAILFRKKKKKFF